MSGVSNELNPVQTRAQETHFSSFTLARRPSFEKTDSSRLWICTGRGSTSINILPWGYGECIGSLVRYLAVFWQIRDRVLVPTVTAWARKDEHPRRQPEANMATTGVLVIEPPFILFKTEVSCNKILLNKSITNSTQTTRILCLAKAWKQSN